MLPCLFAFRWRPSCPIASKPHDNLKASKHGMEWVLEHALLARSQVEGGVSPKTSFLSTDRRVLRACVSVRGNSSKTVTRTVSNGAHRRANTSNSDLDSCRLD